MEGNYTNVIYQNEDEEDRVMFGSDFIVGIQVILEGHVQFYSTIILIAMDSLFVFVLLQKHMWSATSFLLSAIAVFDSIAAITCIPTALYIFLKDLNKPVPYGWCGFLYYKHVLQVTFHSASIWLTVVLGVFRYISVCYPFKATYWCTMRRAVIASSTSVFMAITINTPHWFVAVIQPMEYTNRNTSINGCLIINQWTSDVQTLIVLNIFLMCVDQLLPYLLLMGITCQLVFTMKSQSQRRAELGSRNTSTGTNTSSAMLLVILVAFLLVEIPFFIFTLWFIINKYINKNREFSPISYGDLWVITYTAVIISSTSNFCIHCCIGTKFRRTLKRLFPVSHKFGFCKNQVELVGVKNSENTHHIREAQDFELTKFSTAF
ncbi:hypothetical protein SNE40_023377 [Patella caerulea]|uniref:G-protein coupled receptors family 1 profile domain-containing protein n=1 Tax=Patella caerulea TaxID=87958 RepID=A0AAN8GC04_PATCE